MSRTYSIDISNASGSKVIEEGVYAITSNINGYDNTTLTPTNVTVTGNTSTFNFTIEATGTLTLHVTETGEATGTAVTGATFNRADASGNTYGDLITTDENGNAVLNNVPFSDTLVPIIYYKQIDSDGNHNFSIEVVSTTLTTNTKTLEIINAPAASQNFNITDANYPNLNLLTGTLSAIK